MTAPNRRRSQRIQAASLANASTTPASYPSPPKSNTSVANVIPAARPKSLLSLPTDLLALITDHLNPDTTLPFPSFTPHWLKLICDLRPSNSKDVRALRGTCRRLRAVIKLQGLQADVNSTKSLQKLLDAPAEVHRGIRRLCIGFHVSDLHDPLKSVYFQIDRLLGKLVNLEELILARSAIFEVSYYTLRDPSSRRAKPDLTCKLPSLRALSVESACGPFLRPFVAKIVTASPKLQHLKLGLNDTDHYGMHPTGSLDFGEAWRVILGGRPRAKIKEIPRKALASLSVRFRNETAAVNMLQALVQSSPGLRELHVPLCDDQYEVPEARHEIQGAWDAETKSWDLELWTWDEAEMRKSRSAIETLAAKIAVFRDLRSLDLGIQVLLRLSVGELLLAAPYTMGPPTSRDRYESYLAQRPLRDAARRDQAEMLRELLHEIARWLARQCPALERGALWTVADMDSRTEENMGEVERWEFVVDRQGQEIGVCVDQWPVRVEADYLCE